jgi:Immune inhibitor A-like, MAM domain
MESGHGARSGRRGVVAAGAALALACAGVPAATAASTGSPGDDTIALNLGDSAAGGAYQQEFTRVFSDVTDDGTPVYIYVPVGTPLDGAAPEGVASMDPREDWNPGDGFVPCADGTPDDYVITQEQIDHLGHELTDQIVAVNEAHFGEMGAAVPGDPSTDSLVTIVYNLHDDSMYDCATTSYTAGYFAPDFIDSAGMNVMAIDAFDWVNRVGDGGQGWDDGDPTNDRPELYEGVFAHELEHLLMNYSDPGELSWVDEGLADFAVFLNGYDVGGSHLTYHQVFHHETSLTRWGGGLESYGASYTFIQYLWEQAGGNGDGTLEPDLVNDGVGGDLLISNIVEEPLDGMAGVQAAIDAFNAETSTGLRSVEELFADWAVAVYLDDEGSGRWDIAAVDFGDPASTRWTIDLANEDFWDDRGIYQGALPDAKWDRLENTVDQTALPFGLAYERFRNPGPTLSVGFSGEPTTPVPPHTGDTHWYAGYSSQSDHVLGVETDGDVQSLELWSWSFIEEGWDYGFVEALVDGEWQTVPLVDDAGETVTTNDDPHGNNTEGNGLTGTSGGEYSVDDPEYVHLTAQLPADTTDLRFRYSTDAAYLDTGWFVDDVVVDGTTADVSPQGVGWFETSGTQENEWAVQLIAACDLTPGTTTPGEVVDEVGNHVYRFVGDEVSRRGFDTSCANGTRRDVTAVVSNLPSGDLTVLDADYDFRLVGSGKGKGKT